MNRWIGGGLVALLVLVLGCGMGDPKGSPDTQGPGMAGTVASAPASAAPAAGHTVRLEVGSAKAADITYGVGVDQSQEVGAAVPWAKDIPVSERPFSMSIVAQNKGGGTITCRVLFDGAVVKENKSTGQYAVVTCSGS